MDNQNLYEQKEHWGKLKTDLKFLRKVNLLQALIPKDVQTILDVGCGDGALTNELLSDSRYAITGLDRSSEALKHVKCKTLVGEINKLPYSDGCFDLVLCSQVLEHLPEEIYVESIGEIQRVARKYLVIGVPYKEKLAQNTTKCTNCGFKFHLWGHVRKYTSLEQIEKLFGNYKHKDHIFSNKMRWRNSLVLWVQQTLTNEWKWEETAICPRCNFKPAKSAFKVRKKLKIFTDRISWIIGEKEDFWWSISLLEKKIIENKLYSPPSFSQ